MSKQRLPRKAKKQLSYLTKVDLDAVLKLQRDYDSLQEDCRNLLMFVHALDKGSPQNVIDTDNDYLKVVYNIIINWKNWGWLQDKEE